MIVTDWGVYDPYFTKEEFDCKETGENEIQLHFMQRIMQLRVIVNSPMVITSGFRSTKHSIEAKKAKPGVHTKGLACDVYVASGYLAWPFVFEAMKLGFSVGVSQNPKGKRFIHLDLRPGDPVLYSY